MVLCILSVICAAVETGLNAAAATYDNPQNDNLYTFFPRWCTYYDTANEGRVNHRGTTAVDALLAAFAIMELIVASIAALLSAKVICCSEDFTQEDTSHMGTPHIQGLPAGAVMYYMAPSGKYNVQTSRAWTYCFLRTTCLRSLNWKSRRLYNWRKNDSFWLTLSLTKMLFVR